jgi:isopenicillin N synthase-like dioxygenase
MGDIVIVEYSDLLAPPAADGGQDNSTAAAAATELLLMEKIEKAFGPNGYGVIGIRGVPSFVEAKKECLTQAYDLAHLSPEELKNIEDPVSLYNAGWSHGKEMLKNNQPDTAKASFYFNPVTDEPGTEADRTKYPVSYPINKWPKESLPTLEPASKRLGCLMKDVAVELSKHIDTYAQSQCPDYPTSMLYSAMKDTEKVKGRLLYYYPLDGSKKDNSVDSWIGFHNDSGYLTALAGDMYMDPQGNVLNECPVPDAGLYVEDRNQQVVKVTIPPDCMAIQMGECTQIVTGGSVVATPHCVKGAPNLVRISLVCFIDVPPSTPISAPKGSSADSILANESTLVPPLSKRWEDGMTFGDFLAKTFQMYYEWNE